MLSQTASDSQKATAPLAQPLPSPSVLELSIVMPCLNEAETLETCIQKAQKALRAGPIAGEIVIADNGSTDGSQEIARRNGARVVDVPRRGYGAALQTGISSAQSKFVIMADADDSYDLSAIQPFVDKLREGYQFVTGTRIKGKIMPGAMPWLHRWIGNPILTGLANILFRTRLSDYHCGMRGFDRNMIEGLHLSTPGMEYATEMIAKVALARVKIAEIPINYYRDGRSRRPHLRTWRDGWRHLSFMLLLSPTWVFLYPGLILTVLGTLIMFAVLPGPLKLGPVNFDVHTLLTASVATIVGVQILMFWLTARQFAANSGLLPHTNLTRSIANGSPLNLGLISGVGLFLLALIPIFIALSQWVRVDFGNLDYQKTLRWLIPGLTLAALGVEVFFASFVLALLNFTTGLNERAAVKASPESRQ